MALKEQTKKNIYERLNTYQNKSKNKLGENITKQAEITNMILLIIINVFCF